MKAMRTVWICMAFAALAFAAEINNTTTNDDGNTATSPPVRLADVYQCPVSPKPMCDDQTCQGSIFMCPTQYRCSSESPFPDKDDPHRQMILAGCRCCPHPLNVWCADYRCSAPDGTRICVGEPLQGCTCLTKQDRSEAT